MLVLQGYVVEYEFILFLPYTSRVKEAIGEGVTRCVSPWCVRYLVSRRDRPWGFLPYVVFQSGPGTVTRG